MKLRAIIVGMAMSAIGASLMNCGSDDAAAPDAGSTTSTTGGIIPSDGSNSSSTGGPISEGFCTPSTCEKQKLKCGLAGDGCGTNIIDCGKCTAGTCGGGGVPSECGGPAACKPKTCDELGLGCGPAGDGCGGPLECGSCTAPEICGGGGPSKCGGGRGGGDGGVLLADGGACPARTTCAPGECGPVPNGCGGLLNCNTCAAGQVCGLNAPSQCGSTICTKLTCAEAGANCGFAADGCGGILNCGGPSACDSRGEVCGLGGPNRCGGGEGAIDSGTCANFCVDQLKNSTCAAGAKTTITGTVYAPDGKLPLPDVFVYIPNGSRTAPYGVAPLTDGTATGSCDQCSIQSLGAPLIATKSLANGTFRLENVPPETTFPLVIQLGKWRRMVTVSPRTRCSTTALTNEQTRFPKRQKEGSDRDNIPLIAVSTGSVDGLECLFYKLGVAQTEFSNPTGVAGGGNGRIRLYRDNDSPTSQGGARINASTPATNEALTNSADNLNQYDAVLFSCPGAPNNNRPAGVDDRVRAYADRGGRVFATHYSYTYLFDNGPWQSTLKWDVANERKFTTDSGQVNTTFPKGMLLSQWLAVPLNASTGVGVGALADINPPRVTIQDVSNNADLPTQSNAQYWITRLGEQGPGAAVYHYTFNTPLGAPVANQCGRVLFSDFHVTAVASASATFPQHCGGNQPGPLTAQEKLLAFFLFDLTSCIQPDIPPPAPACTPKSCTAQNISCGKAGDGCGGQQDCPVCPASQVCQGNPPICKTPACTPTTCEAQGAECGVVANGCGQPLQCPDCPPGLTCGGNGPNKCGANSCAATTCQAQGILCGRAGDGCGKLLECGTCPQGQTCGGGGTPNVCGAPTCTRLACTAEQECGAIADGCGDVVQCGTCPPGTRCGTGGIPNKCALVLTR